MASYTLANNGLDHAFFFMIPIYYINQCWLISNESGYIHLTVCNFIYAQDIIKMHWRLCILSLKPHFPRTNVLELSYRQWWYWPTRLEPIFCLLLLLSKLRLSSANHRPGYWSDLPCDWPSTAWAYQEKLLWITEELIRQDLRKGWATWNTWLPDYTW